MTDLCKGIENWRQYRRHSPLPKHLNSAGDDIFKIPQETAAIVKAGYD